MRSAAVLVACCLIVAGAFGCALVREIAGVEFDKEAFDLARQAKVLELHAERLARQAKTLANNDILEKTDFLFLISEDGVQAFADRLDSITDTLDDQTSYTIRHVRVSLQDGAAFATIDAHVNARGYGVGIDVVMDAILVFTLREQGVVEGRFELFNISPKITKEGIFLGNEELLENILRRELAEIGRKLPVFQVPVTMPGIVPIKGTRVEVITRPRFVLTSPNRLARYRLRLVHSLFFDGKALLAFSLEEITVE